MIQTFLWRSLQFSKWLIKSKSCHSIHSPLLFKLCRYVFCQPLYESIWLFKKWSSLVPPQYKSIATKSALHPFDAKLLLGLTRFINPEFIIEIGTGFGFSTTILYHATPKSSILTFEKDVERLSIAQKTFFNLHTVKYSSQKVMFINQRFPTDSLNICTSQPYLVFIDGGHNEQQMNSYSKWLFQHLPESSIIVLHDIYWSKEMLKVWKAFWHNDRTTFWIDMFRLGILILDYPARKMKVFLRPGPPFFIPL